jgi:hypothetical protein
MGDIDKAHKYVSALHKERDNLLAEKTRLEAEITRLRLYERAMQSIANQFVCPKISAEELAKRQLGLEEE